jgi:hypothetical protein
LVFPPPQAEGNLLPLLLGDQEKLRNNNGKKDVRFLRGEGEGGQGAVVGV